MRRSVSTLLAAAMAITGSAVSFAPAAVAVPQVSPAIFNQAAPAAGVQQVRDHSARWRQNNRNWSNNRNWGDWRRDNRHYSRNYRYGNRYYGNRYYRYRDNDNGSAIALGIFGLAAGAIVGSQLRGGGYGGGSSYDAACHRKYNSYDSYSKTFLGYDGYRHRCVLP